MSSLHHSYELAYVDLDEGELMHWKYIKRKKLPNGKWRYYYDVNQLKDDLGFDERERLRLAERYKANAEYSEKKLHDAWKHAEDKSPYGSLANAWTDAYKRAQRAGDEYVAAKEAYMKTPLGKLDKVTENVSNFLSKMFGKKKQ